MVKPKSAFINMHGISANIKTAMSEDKIKTINNVHQAIASKDFLEVQRAFYKGGFKDANNNNIQKSAKRIEELVKRQV